MVQLQWIKSRAGTWLPFQTFDLSTSAGYGVYAIWHSGQPGRVVRVGQGDIPARIGAHRNDMTITKYNASGTLLVTWANVGPSLANGIERYMGDNWHPLVGSAFPAVKPIAVNSPW